MPNQHGARSGCGSRAGGARRTGERRFPSCTSKAATEKAMDCKSGKIWAVGCGTDAGAFLHKFDDQDAFF